MDSFDLGNSCILVQFCDKVALWFSACAEVWQ